MHVLSYFVSASLDTMSAYGTNLTDYALICFGDRARITLPILSSCDHDKKLRHDHQTPALQGPWVVALWTANNHYGA